MQEDLQKFTSELRRDHRLILEKFDQLVELAQRLSDSPQDAQTPHRLVDEIRERLNRHLEEEETKLFPMLRRGGLIEAVRQEHRELKASVVLPLQQPDTVLSLNALDKIGESLRGHISREEKVLFWLAEVKIKEASRS